MRWGFAWDRGPFEVWDIIGLEKSADRMKEEGMKLPEWIEEMLSSGKTSFYTYVDGAKHYYCPTKKDYVAVPVSEKRLCNRRRREKNGY